VRELDMKAYYIRAGSLKPCIDLIKELGVDPLRLMKVVGISDNVIDSSDAVVPLESVIDLVELASKETKCEHFGLLLGSKVSIQSLGLLGLLIRSASTFEEGINVIIKHLSLSVTGVRRSLMVDSGVAIYSSTYESNKIALSRQARQVAVSLSWNLLKGLSSENWQPISISFSYSEPNDAAFYRKLFKTRVTFNGDYVVISFNQAYLKIKLNAEDVHLHQTISNQLTKNLEKIKHKNIVDEVKNYIAKNLEIGICSEDEVVKFFPLQKRTLQQKLKEFGTSYQKLLDNLRFEKAEMYLSSSTLKMYQIADLLCYQSSAAFSFAFSKRYGLSPSRWKNAHKVNDIR
jgi:AraC-like DNA-binding protein